MKKKKKPIKDMTTEKSKGSSKENLKTKKDDDNRPDFGGIPARDLKKNLGCG